LIARTPDLVG
jgi:hypothetical protein